MMIKIRICGLIRVKGKSNMSLLKIYMSLHKELRKNLFSQTKFCADKHMFIEHGLSCKKVYILENAILKYNAYERIYFADENLQMLTASDISASLSMELSISSEETFSVLKELLQCIIWDNFYNNHNYSKLDNRCLMILSEQGDDNALMTFAIRSFKGEIPNMSTEKQYEVSIQLFEKLADAGNLDAIYYCGQAYLLGHGYPENSIQALALIKKAADAGNGHALNRLGMLYLKGYEKLNIAIDNKIALKYFTAAKKTGLVDGYQNCAVIYFNEGEFYNIPKAIENFEVAANSGDSNAQCGLGIIYHAFNIDMKYKNYDKARFWYEKAVEQGDEMAANNLAVMYADGLGVEKNIENAIYYYAISAEKGFANAQFALGQIYEFNEKFRDSSKAAYWYEKSANQGHSISCNNLGVLYGEGKLGTNIDENLKKAGYWCLKGEKAGSKKAAENLRIYTNRFAQYSLDKTMGKYSSCKSDNSVSIFSVNNETEIICPVCHSPYITTKNKGFSIGKAVVGSVLFGPLGLIGGASGSNKLRLACMKCGYEWAPNSIVSKIAGKLNG